MGPGSKPTQLEVAVSAAHAGFGVTLTTEVVNQVTDQFGSVAPIAILFPFASTPVAPAEVDIGSSIGDVVKILSTFPPKTAPEAAMYYPAKKFLAILTVLVDMPSCLLVCCKA